MPLTTNDDRELLRHATLEVLAARHPTALPFPGIRRRIAQQLDFPFHDSDLESALDFGKSQGWLTFTFDEAGSSKWWSATAAGLLKIERGQSRIPSHD